jgi:GT2 family glycosyltransferase
MTMRLTVVIPTYRREQVLLETIGYMLALRPEAAEILVIDQTEVHEPPTCARLGELEQAGRIVWVRRQVPSITAAMNHALEVAKGDIVLFVDDDVRPEPALFAAHLQAHEQHPISIVAGRVIQPWQEGTDFESVHAPAGFHFASTRPAVIREFMGGNFSLPRALGLALGGFDENFVKVAYRFEAEFASRFVGQGGKIHFEPRACLHHLKALAGGTRTFGEHLTTWRADHAVGAYYYSLRCRKFLEFLVRPCRAISTRYHLQHPWRIPATLFAELSGMLWALVLHARGPKRLGPATRKGHL